MRVAILAVVAACGRFHFGALDDGAAADVALGSFAMPVLAVPLMAPGVDDDPTATDDGLELYFASERIGAAGGYADIYVSTRSSRASAWSAPTNVTVLNSADEDQSPGITADGLTMYYTSRRPSPIGGTSSNIWVATRAARSDAWSAPTFVAELSTTLDEFDPQPDPTHLRLVLYRQLTATNRDIYESTRASTSDPWGTPVLLDSVVNAPGGERSPCLAAGGLELWFGSDRASAPDVHDIYVATRPSTSEPFVSAIAVDVLDSPQDDVDPWLSSDGRVILFSSDRTGDAEIYEAQR